MRLVGSVVGLGLFGSMAWAEPVLHERIYFGAEAARCKNGVCTTNGPHGPEVTAVEQGGRMLQAPADGPAPAPGEQIFRPEPETIESSTGGPPLPGDPPPSRRGHVQMDSDTGTDVPVAHTYHAVFTPSEFPYKRVSALDWADETEALVVFDSQKRTLPVAGTSARRPDYDAFWGSIVVDLEPERWVPMPSVAADARVLSWRTDPPVAANALEFARDGADNMYVRAARDGGAGGQRRLIWLTDAPQAYFGGAIPAARLDEEPRTLLRPLPQNLRREAQTVLDTLAVHPSPHTPVESVLFPIVSWFRSFEAGQAPPPSGSRYRDLALGKHGVCRHRGYAFVITALAAGIPARYVENELHVFVEVYLPHAGWRRINLGGAAPDEQLAGGDERPIHRPRGEDGLPRPPQYAAHALPPDHRKPDSGPRESGHVGTAVTTFAHVDLATMLEDDARMSTAKQGAAGKVATHTRIVVGDRLVYRGDTIEVSGDVTDDTGAPAADLPLEVYLDSALGAQRIGHTRTGPDGRYDLAALIPPSLQLGNYSVVARTPGDPKHAASSSRTKR